MPGPERLHHVIDRAVNWVTQNQQLEGNWDGKISSETMVTAWLTYGLWLWEQPEAWRGLEWLVRNQNPDGGWGGSFGQPSYLDATFIALTVLQACQHVAEDSPTVQHGREYIEHNDGELRGLSQWLAACVSGDFTRIPPPRPGLPMKRAAYVATLFPGLLRRTHTIPRYLHEPVHVMALGFASQSENRVDRLVRRRGTRLLESLWTQQRRWIMPGLSLAALRRFGEDPNQDILGTVLRWTKESQNEDGGWGWCPSGQFLDTSLTVLALLEAGTSLESPVIRNAVTWIKNQWALEGAWGPHCAAPPDADDTGAALWVLLNIGESPDSPFVSRAVSFLKRDQNANGSWGYPPWIGANLAEDTAIASRALLATGERDAVEAARRGLSWLINHQLPTGSWPFRWYLQDSVACFRTVDAFRAAGYPRSSGTLRYASSYLLSKWRDNEGRSGIRSVEDAAYSLLALLDLEDVEHPVIRDGIAWLIEQQTEDGTWPVGYSGYMGDVDGAWMSYYRDRMWTHAHALWVLAKYRKRWWPETSTMTVAGMGASRVEPTQRQQQ